jgi:hypothetical protein
MLDAADELEFTEGGEKMLPRSLMRPGFASSVATSRGGR